MITGEPEMLWPQFCRPSLFTLYGTNKRINPNGQTCCYCCWSDHICRLCRPPRLLQVPFPSVLSNTLGSYSFHGHFHAVLFLVLLLKWLLFTKLQSSSNKNSPVVLYLSRLKSQIQYVVAVEDSFLFWLNQTMMCDARSQLVDWLKKKKNSCSENNLQSLQQADSGNLIASIIESVRGSLAWSHLHGVFTVVTSVMATGTKKSCDLMVSDLRGSSLAASRLAPPPGVRNADVKWNVEGKISNPSQIETPAMAAV